MGASTSTRNGTAVTLSILLIVAVGAAVYWFSWRAKLSATQAELARIEVEIREVEHALAKFEYVIVIEGLGAELARHWERVQGRSDLRSPGFAESEPQLVWLANALFQSLDRNSLEGLPAALRQPREPWRNRWTLRNSLSSHHWGKQRSQERRAALQAELERARELESDFASIRRDAERLRREILNSTQLALDRESGDAP